MTVLLVGGTGRLGRAIAAELATRDEPVRALVRSGKRAVHLRALGMELEVGDLLDARSLPRALNDVRVVVASAQGDPLSRRAPALRVDDQGNRNLITAAGAANVEHFVFISALKADEGAATVARLGYKHAAEGLLQSSAMTYTILRPALFQETFAPESPLGRIIARFGVGLLPRGGRTPHSFIAIADVARAAALALDRAEAHNQLVPIGGPEDLSYREAYKRIAQLAGQRIVALSAPAPLPAAGGLLAAPFWPGLRGALAWSVFLERAGGTCVTPDWLAEALGRRRIFDAGVREMYNLPPSTPMVDVNSMQQ
jgi:uncharacterized protein YbjT (DUF2867 family)